MKIHFAHSDSGDWIGLFVDGKNVYEGHSISESTLVEKLGLSYTTSEHTEEEMENMGFCFPQKENDLIGRKK